MEYDENREFSGPFEVPTRVDRADEGVVEAAPQAPHLPPVDDDLTELCRAFHLTLDESTVLSRQGQALMACSMFTDTGNVVRAALKRPSNSNALLLVFESAGAGALYDK